MLNRERQAVSWFCLPQGFCGIGPTAGALFTTFAAFSQWWAWMTLLRLQLAVAGSASLTGSFAF
jgi:hypothetical protein